MSQKTNPTVIGLFVLVGIGIALAAGLILTSGRWFKETHTYVMVFDGNVSGLLPGAPVQYRGVTIGSVKEIKLMVNRTEQIANVPVIVEFDPSLITFVGEENHETSMSGEINEGLRAQLESQSLVTGLKKIMLVDRPDVPIQMRSMLEEDIPEVPTCPNLGESLINELQALPLEEMVLDTHATLQNLNAFTASLAEEETVKATRETLVAVLKLSTRLEQDLPRLTAELSQTLAALTQLTNEFDPVAESMATELPGIINGLEENMASFFQLQNNLNDTLKEIQNLMNRNSTSRYQITDMMTKVSELVVKASQFLEFLERHPESILTGKSE